MRKRYLKTKPVCRVCFELPKEACTDCREVSLVGEFNNWDQRATPMKRLRDGSFSVTLDLPVGREFQFRYVIDGWRWENDWCADRYLRSEFEGNENSVVVT